MLSKLIPLGAIIAAAILTACVDADNPPVDNSFRFDGGNERLQSCIETQCRELDLDGYSLEDFSVLNELTHVESLMVSRTNIADLNQITGMTQLKELHIAWTEISDLSALPAFANLDVLHVTGMDNVTDYSPVYAMSHVSELATDLDDNMGLGFVAAMPNLATLYIGGGRVTDLTPLAGHPKISHLTITTAIDAEMAPLLQMPALRRATFNTFALSDTMIDLLEARGVVIDPVPVVVC